MVARLLAVLLLVLAFGTAGTAHAVEGELDLSVDAGDADPRIFAFFKGLNDPADGNGELTAQVNVSALGGNVASTDCSVSGGSAACSFGPLASGQSQTRAVSVTPTAPVVVITATGAGTSPLEIVTVCVVALHVCT
ncbi:hypothetical protein FKR81_36595 [Lentzea tibetensis]|uniref:DUF11 domain-containing protein n=1 Tax=Lentzea tibetensis TaxID=2591470 RepID=A0A563EHV7_9PSEU|nr:hypothetical protein [Lentzea tibetensis]TWP46260.1 hypothetical protein FKR81_36595 [Lentzea tibetensis]